MNFKFLFSILVAFMVTFSNPLSAQCVGVHINQWWDCTSSTANATAYPQGGTAPYTYLWDNGETNQSTSGLQPGQHKVTVTDAVGCLHVEACIVIVPECCLWATTTSTPDDCHPAQTGQGVIWQIGGGTAPYTILLPDGTIKTNYGNTPVFINNLAAGVWYITITDASGCSIEQPVEIEQEKSPIVNLFSNGLTCTAATTDITTQVTNGPVTFLWNTGATTNKLTNVGPGTYTVMVTNANGCSDSDTITISAPAQVVLSATATPTACGENNGMVNISTTASTVTVVAPNGAIYNLNGSATITNLQPGVYEITATNSNGCSMVETVIVDDSQVAKDSVSCVTICQPSFVNGVWVSSSTTLTDTLINANGCDFLFKLMVNLQTIDTTHQTAFTCFGGVITVNGVEYKKDTTVYAQTNGNCPGLTIWDLQFSDEPDTLLMPAVKVCGGDSASVYTFENTIGINTDCAELVVIRTFEHQPYTLQYSLSSADTICGFTNRTDSLFQKISVDNQNCVITQPYGLLVTNTPKVDTIPGPTHYICGTPASTIWVETKDIMNLENCSRKIEGYWQITGPKPPMVILYQDTCYNGPLPIAPVQILHSDCNPDTLIIPIPYNSVITPISKNLCYGDTLHFGNINITEAGSYEVFAGQTTHGCDSVNLVNVTMVFGSKFQTTQDTCDLTVAGEKFWTVTTSPNGCVDSTEVTLKWVPGFEIDSVKQVCRKVQQGCESIIVFDPLNGCWGWLHISSEYFPETKSEVKYTCDENLAGQTTEAWIPAMDSTQCDTIAYLHWVLNQKPDVSAKATDNKCNGDENGSIELTVSGGTAGYTYSWGQPWVAGENPTNLPAGTYTVTVTDANGCTNSTSATVTEPNSITINASADDAECDGSGGFITANANGGEGAYTYLWSNGLAMPFGNANAGTYTVTVTDANGCTNSTEATVWAPTLPTITISFDSIRCDSAGRVYANIALEPGMTIQWFYNGAQMFGDSTSVVAQLPGNYSIMVTNEYGCIATAMVFVPAPYCPRPKLPCELLIVADEANHSIHVTVTPDGFDQSEVETVDWVVFSPLDPQGSGQAGVSTSADFEVLVQHYNIDPETWYIQIKNIRINGEDFEPETGANTKFCVKFEN